MAQAIKQPVIDFYTYPPVGADDWRYTFQTAQVRVLEMQMLTRAAILDMANAENFGRAADLLSATEYALPSGGKGPEEIENILLSRRYAVRELFADLMLDKPLVHLFKTRDDFANLRLALRRALTGKPLGADYSKDGNVSPELFEQVFSQEGTGSARFPDYMQQAADKAALAYYQNKDVRQIDYAIDSFQAQYNLEISHRLESIFLLGLFRIQVDLTNIRTMFRLKSTQSQNQFLQDKIFFRGGYLTLERLKLALDVGYESLGQLFFVTPYWRVVEAGANYLTSNKSFLKLEQQCDNFLTGFLKTTIQITAGPQPIIAYLLLKENEIRTVRLLLTAKKNSLDTKLILDRVS
jgi:V/A-type H+-transporting ATPase subunit C